jgi:hypothetical protein
MPRLASNKSNRWLKILASSGGGLIVLAVAAIFIGQAWLNRYLRSPEFRDMLESKTGRNIRAQVEIAPIQFDGGQFFCETFRAQGTQDAAFSIAKVDDLRGEVSIPSIVALIFGERRFRIPKIEVQRLNLEFFDRDRLNLLLPEKEKREDRSVLENLYIRDVQLAWGGGGLSGASVHAAPVDGGWRIEGQGGRIVQLGLPPIDVVNARLVRKDHSIYIQEARLRQNGGELTMSGEIASKDKADLLVNLSNIHVTPLLTEDWRAKLHGYLSGELRIQIPLAETAPMKPTIAGKLRLDKGVLEALPVLNKIADYLRTDRFRRVELSQASANIRYDATGLRIDDLVLESKQLIAIRGRLTYSNGQIDGTFDVGITPGPLQWIPGSQTKVFTTQRDGYVWAPMRVTGPPGNLKEDLSQRLLAAAGGAVVEKVESTATEAVDSAVENAKKGASGVFDLLFGN